MSALSTIVNRKVARLKLLIIFNPKAAAGRSVRLLNEIQSAFDRCAIEVQIQETSAAGDGRRRLEETDLSNFDGVVAAGGDGTLHEVMNGLLTHPADQRIPLGLIPVGTGNAFARELNLDPQKPAEAVDIISRGNTRQIDIAKVTSADGDFYFINVMHMGFSVAAGLSAQKLKFLGNAAYTLATLWQILKLKSYSTRARLDGKLLTEELVFTTVSNSRYTGTHFLISPEAVIDDGRLDVISLRKLSRRRVLRLFPTIYNGKHLRFEEVSSTPAKHIRLESPGGMLLGPDGEFCGRTPAEIHCMHRELTMFFPA